MVKPSTPRPPRPGGLGSAPPASPPSAALLAGALQGLGLSRSGGDLESPRTVLLALGGPRASGGGEPPEPQAGPRLHEALLEDYPLVARLLGPSAFDHLCRDFLLAHPPGDAALTEVGTHLGAYLLASAGPAVPWEALAEAVGIDEAVRRARFAPLEPRLCPGHHRPGQRLWRSQAWTLLEARWPLVELLAGPEPGPGLLPPPLAASQAWAIGGGGALRLEPCQARLLELVGQLPLAEALGRVEKECAAADLPALPAQVQGWLRQGLEVGLWVEPAWP